MGILDSLRWDTTARSPAPMYVVNQRTVDGNSQCSATETCHSMNCSVIAAPRVVLLQTPQRTVPDSVVAPRGVQDSVVLLQTPQRTVPDAVVAPSGVQDSLPSAIQLHAIPSPNRCQRSS